MLATSNLFSPRVPGACSSMIVTRLASRKGGQFKREREERGKEKQKRLRGEKEDEERKGCQVLLVGATLKAG